MPVAVDVAEKAEQALSIAEGVVARHLNAAGADLRGEGGQRVPAVSQRAELCRRAGKTVESHDGHAAHDVGRRDEADTSAI